MVPARPMHTSATTTSTGGRLLTLVPAVLVGAMALSAGAVSAYAPPERGEMAVVFAPWVGEAEAYAAILAAGGQFSGNSRFGNIPIAFASDVAFKTRVMQHGAILVIAATGLCGPIGADTGSGQAS